MCFAVFLELLFHFKMLTDICSVVRFIVINLSLDGLDGKICFHLDIMIAESFVPKSLKGNNGSSQEDKVTRPKALEMQVSGQSRGKQGYLDFACVCLDGYLNVTSFFTGNLPINLVEGNQWRWHRFTVKMTHVVIQVGISNDESWSDVILPGYKIAYRLWIVFTSCTTQDLTL